MQASSSEGFNECKGVAVMTRKKFSNVFGFTSLKSKWQFLCKAHNNFLFCFCF